jgi:hypothetical protein
VCNLDYCYFEQDFFYLSCDATTGAAVLRELRTDETHTTSNTASSGSTTSHSYSSSSSGSSAAVSKHMPVDRRGIFRLQTTDADMLGALREQVKTPYCLYLKYSVLKLDLYCQIVARCCRLYNTQPLIESVML